MEKVLTKEQQQGDKSLWPWMPYIFGFIFLMGASGFFFLFSEKGASKTENLSPIVTDEQIIHPVKNLLQEIKSKQLKNGYSRTSSDFQMTMPYEVFASFIHQYDSLQEWSTLSFSKPQVEKNLAGVVASLHFDDQPEHLLPISFTLIQEEGTWKIYGFILNTDTVMPILEMEQLQSLIHAVNLELSTLKNENFTVAYYKYATEHFQRENPYQTFIEFIHHNPIFSHYESATYQEAKVEGSSGHIRIHLHSEEENIPVEFTLTKEDGQWKVDQIELLIPLAAQKPLDQKQIDDSMEMIDLFLKTLHQGLYEKAYTLFTSSGFQKSTSLHLFEAFLKDHPILQKGYTPKFMDGGKSDNLQVVYLLYGKAPYRSSFEVTLLEEADGWKIQGISLEAPQTDTYAETLDQDHALDLAQSILNMLGSKQYERFYIYATSGAFKKATSYSEMIDFLNAHPVLKSNPKAFLQEMVQDRDKLFLETELIDDSHLYSALFVFAFEDGGWRLNRFETKSDRQIAELAGPINVELSKILIGQKIDDLGMIQDAGSTLQLENEPIYLSILLVSPLPGPEVTVQLYHTESNSKTFPISGKIDDEGNNILTFSFNPPEWGWPDGHYKANAQTQDQNILETPFVFQTPSAEDGTKEEPLPQQDQ